MVMLKKIKATVGYALCVGISVAALSTNAISAEYKGAPRTFLYNPAVKVELTDTTKYKKSGPYTIGFSNAGLGDSWRVVMQHSLMQAAADNSKLIKKLIVTNANHDDAKQASDIQDLISQGIDILIVSANTQKALDPVITRVMKSGIPVVLVDRRIASDNFVSFVTASDPLMGRMFAQWIVEKLKGKGNVVMLAGQAGSSPSENREIPARQVFAMYPDIKILDTVYSDWSPVKGKQQMEAMIAKYGKKIDAVWSAHGLQTPGSIDAFLAAGYKAGQIPMHTSADVNGPLQMALKYKVPMLEVGYPPAMGGKAIEVALKVLQGSPVPKIFEINAQVGLTRGDETPSVSKPDLYIDEMVVKNGPADMLITSGLGPNYDPTTFKVKVPGVK
jgi:ribose transport system substrate-binding protein